MKLNPANALISAEAALIVSAVAGLVALAALIWTVAMLVAGHQKSLKYASGGHRYTVDDAQSRAIGGALWAIVALVGSGIFFGVWAAKSEAFYVAESAQAASTEVAR